MADPTTSSPAGPHSSPAPDEATAGHAVPGLPGPDFCRAAAELALEQGKHPVAAGLFEEYLRSVPDAAGAHRKLGFCRFEMGDFKGAVNSLERAVALRPDRLQPQVMLGMALHAVGRRQEGRAALEAALGLETSTDLERVMRGQIRILLGDWPGGWHDMEAKWNAPQLRDGLTFRPSMDAPLWDGSPVPGRTLCVHSETGSGDNIMFSRFLPFAAARVERLVLVAPPSLTRLLGRIEGVAEVVGHGEVPGGAVHTSIWSLPAVLGTSLESLPSPQSYLIPPDSGPELGERTRPRVGLVWAGGPGPAHDRDRSCPAVELLAPLLDIGGIDWISLQVGRRAGEGSRLGIYPMPLVADFADTAYLISQLDLVITVDTSVAHLAAALGRPTWVMVPTMPEFRWLLDREDTPWYPTARLFRRRHTREWPEMIERVRDAMSAWVGDRVSVEATGVRGDQGPTAPPQTGGLPANTTYLLAKAAMEKGEHRLAASLFDEYLQKVPDSGKAYRKLGYCRFMLAEYEACAEALRRAVEHRPNHIQSIVMLGMALHPLGEPEEGVRFFERALSLVPTTDLERTMLGQLHLLFGDFERGLPAYEARWTAPQLANSLPFRPGPDRPLWDGSPAPGRTLCIVAEGGYGDVIMFSRFVPLVAPMVGRAVFLISRPVQRLVARMNGSFDVVTRWDEVPAGALFTSIWSLPAHVGTRLESLPETVPYLSAPPDGPLLGTRRRPRVGLVWAGGDHTTHNHDRSMQDPNLLRTMLDVDGIEWVSLQVGVRAGEGERLGIPGLPAVEDFADTAFVISQLDLVISVDTAVAHLSGAMGKPTWIMIPTFPEFRWLLDRTDSPWYPSARLYRRRSTRGWPEVVRQLRVDLERWESSNR